MKTLTLLQAAALVMLALYGASAGADNPEPCSFDAPAITCHK